MSPIESSSWSRRRARAALHKQALETQLDRTPIMADAEPGFGSLPRSCHGC